MICMMSLVNIVQCIDQLELAITMSIYSNNVSFFFFFPPHNEDNIYITTLCQSTMYSFVIIS